MWSGYVGEVWLVTSSFLVGLNGTFIVASADRVFDGNGFRIENIRREGESGIGHYYNPYAQTFLHAVASPFGLLVAEDVGVAKEIVSPGWLRVRRGRGERRQEGSRWVPVSSYR